MKRTGRKKEWSVLGFCIFLFGVFPPILLVFDKPVLVLELPLSFLYLYGLWALMILFIAIGARRRQMTRHESGAILRQSEQDTEIEKSVHDYV